MFIGTSISCIGYAGRAWYSKSPAYSPYVMQAVCVTIAPGFIIGGIKRLLIHQAAFLRMKKLNMESNWYTDSTLERFNYFETANKISVIATSSLIGSGIGTFYDADNDGSILTSAKVVLAGFSIQLGFTVIPILFWIFFIYECCGQEIMTRRVKHYMVANLISLLLLIIRLSYRVAEWDKIVRVGLVNQLAQDEDYLLCLDALPILLATIIMILYHPGFTFGRKELADVDAEFREYKKQRKLSHNESKERLKKKINFKAFN